MDAVLVTCAGAVTVLMVATWGVSLAVRDASIVDIVWGLGFVLVAWIAFAMGDAPLERRLLVSVLVTVWAVRLAGYMLWRKRGEGEDFRYREMRARYGDRFSLVSLFSVFLFQGLGMWAVSLPVQAAQALPGPGQLTTLDVAGTLVWAVGMVFEAGGDAQLVRFRRDPANRGRVLDHGLWRYTRHPNYFGDLCVWWGLFLIALAADSAWWTVVGPLTMGLIITKLFGVPLMDAHLAERKPGYADYMRRTYALVPCPRGPRWPREAASPPRGTH
jgi:steroid 5-alpha reductase family enzyme